ncbi:hypothetical protein GE21DRAFT_1053470 [Neurospora crassa]|nr:hypothetical protein GE21DRAFT_1053470 [Neurospora crassa]
MVSWCHRDQSWLHGRYANKLVATMLPCSGGPLLKHTYLLPKARKGVSRFERARGSPARHSMISGLETRLNDQPWFHVSQLLLEISTVDDLSAYGKPQGNQSEWICKWVREFDYKVCLRKNLQPPDWVTRLLTDDLVWPGRWDTLRSLNGNERSTQEEKRMIVNSQSMLFMPYYYCGDQNSTADCEQKKDGQPKSKPKSTTET